MTDQTQQTNVRGYWLASYAPGPTVRVARGVGRRVLAIGVRPWITAILCLLLAGTASQQATSSGPGWRSILSGVWVDQHGVRDNSFAGYQAVAHPHCFRHLLDNHPAASLSSIVQWSPIDSSIVAPADPGGDAHRATASPGSSVAAAAAHRLTQADPDVMFLHFDDVDHAGHSFGYSPTSPNYLAAIAGVDADIGTVVAAMQARPGYAAEDWLVVVTTDHGGLGTGHGGQSSDQGTVFIIASGGAVFSGVISPGPGHTAVPPTVFSHLGVPIDPRWGWVDPAFGVDPLCPGNVVCSKDLDAGALTLAWTIGDALDITGLEVPGGTVARPPTRARWCGLL